MFGMSRGHVRCMVAVHGVLIAGIIGYLVFGKKINCCIGKWMEKKADEEFAEAVAAEEID